MKPLTKYLLEKGVLQKDSIYWINKHKMWCENYGTSPVKMKFNEIVVYVEDLMLSYQDIATVNNIIAKVYHYYEYLLHTKKIRRNLFRYEYLEKEKERIFAILALQLEVPNKRDRYKKRTVNVYKIAK